MEIIDNKKQYILNNYSQEHLFAKYLKVELDDILYCLEDRANKIHNPLRYDFNASLGFMTRDDGRLYMKDWANSLFEGDIFDLVSILTDIESNGTGFAAICDIIINNADVKTQEAKGTRLNTIRAREVKTYKFKARPYRKNNFKVYDKVGIRIPHLKYRKVFAADYVWINNISLPSYIYNSNDPAYIYFDNVSKGEDIVKLYRPYAEKRFKFSTNSSYVIECANELYETRVLVITKSRKDKLLLESVLSYDNYDDLKTVEFPNVKDTSEYCITSFNSESARLTLEEAEILNRTYDYVIINTDFDKEGIMNAFYHSMLYGFYPIMLGNNNFSVNNFTSKEIYRFFNKMTKIKNIPLYTGMLRDFINSNKGDYDVKDVYDYTAKYGVDKGRSLINNIFNYEQFTI